MTATTELRDDGRADAGSGPSGPRWLQRRRVLIGTAALVVLAGVAVWVVAFSSVLGVRTIQVTGTHVLTAAQVERAAGIADGTPLVRIDTAAVAARVESLPAVASAQVSTSMPSTVVIAVTERRPVGWLAAGRQDVLVDRSGARYRSVSHAPRRLPHLILPSGADRATTAAVARVAAALPAPVRHRVASVQALEPSAITLLLRGDRVVHWGSAQRSADKALILPVLLRRAATVIDVSNPDRPFTH